MTTIHNIQQDEKALIEKIITLINNTMWHFPSIIQPAVYMQCMEDQKSHVNSNRVFN